VRVFDFSAVYIKTLGGS